MATRTGTPMTPDGFEALLGEFVLDVRERLDRVEQWLLDLPGLKGDARDAALVRVKRELHTLKGNAGMMGLTDLQELAHRMEDEAATGAEGIELVVSDLLEGVDRYRARVNELDRSSGDDKRRDTDLQGATASDHALSGVRVPFAVLDPLLDLIGEMVILRNRLSDCIASGSRLDVGAADFGARLSDAWDGVTIAHDALSRTLDFVQERVMALRMTPLKALFGSLRRIVHDEAARTGKKAELATEGGDTPLDKALLDLANDALGHLVRNAVIHGIETPEERVAAKKPPAGGVKVKATAKGDEVWIEISDDGAGIDRERLVELAGRRGVVVDEQDDIVDVLFEAGFTTKDTADMGSGRGIGLSAVRDAVQRQGGDIEITTEVGKGTTFLLRLPLSISIARALLVEADGEHYAVPLNAVIETRRLRTGEGHRVNHAGVYVWREDVLTLLDLGCQFETAVTPRDEGYVIVIEAAGKCRGLLADEILGVREVVVKALDPIVGHPPGVGGSTVLGDGRPILILEPRKLVELEPFVLEAA